MRLVNNIKKNLINIPGWRTNRKIIVIESDDWGCIRMPSKKTCQTLIHKGIIVDKKDPWNLDCLESKDDLDELFSIISSYKDNNANFPIFTFNTVMGNPDFEKIKESKFETFYHQHFFNSYKHYHGTDLQQTWKQGIQDKLIQPQFHAKEHLNVSLWLKDLRNGLKNTRIAFDQGFFGLVTETTSHTQVHYLAAYRAESSDELNYIKGAAIEGLDIFEKTFGFRSKTFIACNYIWPEALEKVLYQNGISLLQGQRGRFQPDPFKKGKGKIIRNYTGQKNILGQTYTVRNVRFEPFEDPNKDWVNLSLKEIQTAFFWHKPAIISTHRINYVGGIDKKHRDRNLKALDLLLKSILKQWPDVIFLSSDQLGLLINEKNN